MTTENPTTDRDENGRAFDFSYRPRAYAASGWEEASNLAAAEAHRNNDPATVEVHQLHITPTGRYAVEVVVHRARLGPDDVYEVTSGPRTGTYRRSDNAAISREAFVEALRRDDVEAPSDDDSEDWDDEALDVEEAGEPTPDPVDPKGDRDRIVGYLEQEPAGEPYLRDINYGYPASEVFDLFLAENPETSLAVAIAAERSRVAVPTLAEETLVAEEITTAAIEATYPGEAELEEVDPALATVECTRCGGTERAGLVSERGYCEPCEESLAARSTLDEAGEFRSAAEDPGDPPGAEEEARIANEAALAFEARERGAVSLARELRSRLADAVRGAEKRLGDRTLEAQSRKVDPSTDPECQYHLGEVEALRFARDAVVSSLAEELDSTEAHARAEILR